jgi:hypothetical protein
VVARSFTLTLSLALAGCRPSPTPEATLAAWRNAVAAGKNGEAYALLSSEWRRSHDQAAFERTLGPPDARARRAMAERWREARATLRADVTLPGGDVIPLVLEDGAWRFAHDPLDVYPQRSPEEALRSFMRAVEHKRWEVVLRFVPRKNRPLVTAEKLRERWEPGAAGSAERAAEIRAQMDAARAHLNEPFEQNGEEARLPVGERKQVKMVREDGLWKVETLE